MAHCRVRDPASRITARQTRPPLQAGFHLLEVLIAVAIVAIVSAIAVPSYSGYVNRVDFATAKVDIKEIEQTIEQYYLDNRGYPASLNDVGLAGKLDPWENAYQYQRVAGASTGDLRKDQSLVPVNSDYDLYSNGKDGLSSKPFPAAKSRDDIVRASDGRFLGYAADF